MNDTNTFSIGIVGSGTAGLISAIILRQAFPKANITIVSSSDIGIIGVGEGSTEHWAEFMRRCDIELEQMIVSSAATHKYGIRFEDWTTSIPRYFHSVGDIDEIFAWGAHATYAYFLEQDKLFTNQTTSIGLVRNQIRVNGLHRATNQFHFDTFKLNEFFTSICFRRMVKFVEGIVSRVELSSENGTIISVTTDRGETVGADFWIDATGFNRILMSSFGSPKWNSFSDYLLCDSAIAFPTESDPSGQIKPYTRAMAMDSGWMWEIPTQERRGNGYVFSSAHCSFDEAIDQAEKKSGYKIASNPRSFKFDAGYLDQPWVKNCAAVGLASSFVEPLEATSIGSTIQTINMLVPHIAVYNTGIEKSQKHYNKRFAEIMRNILTMIRLHYYSDRRDSEFWQDMANMPVNDELMELIELWSERPPVRTDVPHNHFELFMTPHMAHVAQGQGLFSSESASLMIDRLNIRREVERKASEMGESRYNHELIDHALALRQLYTINDEWS